MAPLLVHPISPHQANPCGDSTHFSCSSVWEISQAFIGKPDFSRAFSDPFLEAMTRSQELDGAGIVLGREVKGLGLLRLAVLPSYASLCSAWLCWF